MKFHMLMLMNEWMMHALMKCKCQMECLTLGCYTEPTKINESMQNGGGRNKSTKNTKQKSQDTTHNINPGGQGEVKA